MAAPLAIGTLLGISMLQGGPLIEAAMAWNGRVSVATPTEIQVRATSNTAATVAFEVAGQPAVVVARNVPRTGVPLAFSVPVDADSPGDVMLRYSVDGGPSADLYAGRIERGPGIVAVAGDTAAKRLAHLSEITIVAAAALPRLSSSYDHIAALAIDQDALSRLDEPQLRAVLEYVGLCGRVLLIDPPEQVEQLMRQRSACGGRYLVAAGADHDAGTLLGVLLSDSPNELPDALALSNLMPQHNPEMRLVIIYLGGFLLIFITLTLMPRLRSTALGFSLLATALSGVLWTGGDRKTLVAWAEVADGDRVARYMSVERASSAGRGLRSLYMRSLSGPPTDISGDGFTLHWGEAARDRYFDWDASLLQEMRVYSKGSFPVEATLRAGAAAAGITVCNRGNGQTPAAFLRWHNANYRVPALAPGARWSPDDLAIVDDRLAPLRMMMRRSSHGGATLMYSLDVPDYDGAQSAWLVRTESLQVEASPCND